MAKKEKTTPQETEKKVAKETTVQPVKSGTRRLWSLLIIFVVAAAIAGYTLTGGPKDKNKTAKVAPSEQSENSDVVKDAREEVVVARVNSREITQANVMDFIANVPQLQQQPIEQVFPLAVEELVTGEIIDIRAEKSDVTDSPEVDKRMKLAREGVVRTVYLENAVKDAMTDERIQKAYDDFIASQKDTRQEEVRARHILVDSEAKAKNIISKLKSGDDFSKLAAEMSSDKPSGENGGDLGYFTKGQMVPAFSDAAFNLKKGEVTSEPVKSQFGYHIIKSEDKRMQPLPELEEVKPFLEVQIRREILEKMLGDWRSEADVEIIGADEPTTEKSKTESATE